MPNWVYTKMTVRGSKDGLDAFAEKAARKYTVKTMDFPTTEIVEKVHDEPLSFWNFIEPEDKDAYFTVADSTRTRDPLNWYNWNVANWGTKWDACDVGTDRDTDDWLDYEFQTAWSPAEPVFSAMAAQHPDLEFEFYCEEEQGWGVVYIGQGGTLRVSRQWDIPNSHADYEDLGRECICESYPDRENFFSDCPRSTAAEELEDISDTLIGSE